MGRDAQTVANEMERKSEVCRLTAGAFVSRLKDPFRICQGLKWDLLMLRAEAMALRDLMKDKGQLNVDEYEKRFKDRLDELCGVMQQSMGIKILEDGTIIESPTSQNKLDLPKS